MFIRLDELQLSYEIAGDDDAETVVLLHGWGGQAASFKPVFDYLSNHYRVIALDLPGFGQSDPPPVPWGTEEYARLLSAFLARNGIPTANVIGHSFGGRIAIVFAANYPEKLGKLVLVDSAGIRPQRTVAYHLRVGVAKLARFLFPLQLLGSFGERTRNRLSELVGSSDYQQAGKMRGTFVKIVNEDLTPRLSDIQAPTLLVWGQNDTATPLSDAKIMEAEIHNAGLVVLPDAGHFSYLDALPQFCRIVSHFLES